MKTTVQTKLFKNGGSKAVRIPANWGFDQDNVTMTFDELTRRILIEEMPQSGIDEFFRLQDQLAVSASDEDWPQRNQPLDDFKNPFEK